MAAKSYTVKLTKPEIDHIAYALLSLRERKEGYGNWQQYSARVDRIIIKLEDGYWR